jgi:hypothetical protein
MSDGVGLYGRPPFPYRMESLIVTGIELSVSILYNIPGSPGSHSIAYTRLSHILTCLSTHLLFSQESSIE